MTMKSTRGRKERQKKDGESFGVNRPGTEDHPVEKSVSEYSASRKRARVQPSRGAVEYNRDAGPRKRVWKGKNGGKERGPPFHSLRGSIVRSAKGKKGKKHALDQSALGGGGDG